MAESTGPAAPANVEQSVIGASLNSSMLLNFLVGIYTMGYAGTMYLYMSRRKQDQKIALTAITVLYTFCLANFILEWRLFYEWIAINGATQDSIFIATIQVSAPSIFALDIFFFYSGLAVSDALLIWRCYHVWGRSFRAITVPLITIFGEISLLIVTIVLSALSGAVAASPSLTKAYNAIISSMIFVSLGTTIITTSLIGFKIYSVTHQSGTSYKHRFNHIIVVLVESAAAYSVVLLIYAIIVVNPASGDLASVMFLVNYYIQPVVNFVSGMAPTVLMARIAITSPDVEQISESSLPHISELKFECAPGQAGGESGESDNGPEAFAKDSRHSGYAKEV